MKGTKKDTILFLPSQSTTHFVQVLCAPISRSFLFVFMFFLCFLSCTRDPVRSRTSFNADWKFFPGDDSLAYLPGYDDSGWRTLYLPHDWSIEGEFSPAHPAKPAGGALPAGIGWYRKGFKMDRSDEDRYVFIDFDGIYRNSEVWINGHYLGERANGYISFRYDLSPYLHYGGELNTIAVKVDNSLQPNSRWYTGSGIYRNVWLVKTSLLHIDHWGLFVFTPISKDNQSQVQITIRLAGKIKRFGNIRIKSTLFDSKGKELAKAEEDTVIRDSIPLLSQQFVIRDPQLWSPGDPYLYKAKVEVFADDEKMDEQIINFGIRYFYFDADSGFFLNGRLFEIRGVNLHHDLGALGAAANKRAIERQLEILKGMGVNAIRTAHNPPAPELLDLCDKMGFLVMDEAFDVWKKKKVKYDYHIDWEDNHRQDLQDLILRDRNHPSVILWSIGNEIREQFDSSGIGITKELVAIVKDLDTTRPVTCALTETDPQKNYICQSGALDLLGFNYKHKDWAFYKERYPGVPMLASENMSTFATRGHYDMPSDSVRHWPEKFGDPILGPNDDYTVSAYDNVCAYWGATHEETLKAYSKYDFIAGIFIWSGFDFLGEPEPYGWPARSSYYGVVDLAGFPKDIYYLYQSIWTDTPVLHVFPHWNWVEGQTVDVWAYYNKGDEVELFLNGKSLGIRKKNKDNLHVMWRVDFHPGTLRVVSRKEGKPVLGKIIRTAGAPAVIELSVDRRELAADGCDLSFITARILDTLGTVVPNADNLINFEITGAGRIAGVDNGYQASHESFKSDKHKAFNGLCLAIIQSNGEKGKISLRASSENLKPAEIILMAK